MPQEETQVTETAPVSANADPSMNTGQDLSEVSTPESTGEVNTSVTESKSTANKMTQDLDDLTRVIPEIPEDMFDVPFSNRNGEIYMRDSETGEIIKVDDEDMKTYTPPNN